MPEIIVQIRNKTASLQGEAPVVVCGNSGYTVTFDLDSEWSVYALKTARFNYTRNGVRLHQDVVFQGSSCQMPVMHDVYEVAIGLYAGNELTSTAVRVPCERSATDEAPEHWIPAPDVYDQLLELLANLPAGAADPSGDLLLLAEGQAQLPEEIGLSTEPTEEV